MQSDQPVEQPELPTLELDAPASGPISASIDQPLPVPIPPAPPEPAETRFLKWVVFGPQGVRVLWSVLLFLVLSLIVMALLGTVAQLFVHKVLHTKVGNDFTAISSVLQEVIQFIGLLTAAAVCARIERRRVLDYNLTGPSRVRHFFTGLLGGFLALSVLVGALYQGHWLQFGAVSLTGAAIVEFGALWGIAFLFTGLSEEGMVRCYMLFTLTRGINYWWALGTVSVFSFFAFVNTHGSGAGGVYLMSALGVLPCLWLSLRKSPSAGFWQAAWLTSTFFGYIHTFNKGETWIGIFCAAALGFVFCVSIRLTGSAWWAIGFHASWDWAQTFFFGTADSGFQPKGHYLTTSPIGDVLWSGGSDGPEGSILVIPMVLLILLVILLVYRRSRSEAVALRVQDQMTA